MRPLIMDESFRAEVARVKKHAEAHRLDRAALLKTIEGVLPPVGDDPGFMMETPIGQYKIVYSIEDQPGGWCAHLSVSVPAPEGRTPGVSALREIARAFGGPELEKADKLWIEPAGGRSAVNLVWKLANENPC